MKKVKFSAGYQPNDILKRTVLANRESVAEIYFPCPGLTSGRGVPEFYSPEKAAEDLAEYAAAGLSLNMLFNGNCYGAASQSRELFNKIGDEIDAAIQKFGLSSITTASPLIAKFVSKNFPPLEVRASVNMEISTPEAMAYLAESFGAFYAKREFNYDFAKLSAMRRWCDANGKKLYILANSGCLDFCPARTFHDNLVAHQHEISKEDNAFAFHGLCREFLSNPEAREDFLRRTNFIRPEDIRFYADLCDGAKLATRAARNPAAIVAAYCAGKFGGNLLDLTEPSHAGHFYPSVLENSRIPDSYAKTRMNCAKNCAECGYCREVQKSAAVILQ